MLISSICTTVAGLTAPSLNDFFTYEGVSNTIDELVNAIYYNVPPTHDGNWALANLEVSLAILESAKNREEITLKHQVPIAAKGT